MRRKQRLPIIFVAVGLVFLLVIALASLVLSIVDYGASSSGSGDSEPSLALPYQPGDFTNAGSGWISYSHDGVEALHGVDISEHQASVDWTALKLAGADYAMIRVGYRGYTDGGLFEDAQFCANVAAARAAGLQVGVYFFSQAITEDEARDEARFVLECIDGLDITWPVAFDWETVAAGGRTDRLSGRDMTACALAFCNAIRRAEVKGAIDAAAARRVARKRHRRSVVAVGLRVAPARPVPAQPHPAVRRPHGAGPHALLRKLEPGAARCRCLAA